MIILVLKDRVPDYYEDARRHEDMFRIILRDIKKNVKIVPEDFDPEMPLDNLFERFSPLDEEQRQELRFCIFDFQKGPLDHEWAGRIGANDFLVGFDHYGMYRVLDKYMFKADGSFSIKNVYADDI